MNLLKRIWYKLFGAPYDSKSDINSPDHDPETCLVCKSLDNAPREASLKTGKAYDSKYRRPSSYYRDDRYTPIVVPMGTEEFEVGSPMFIPYSRENYEPSAPAPLSVPDVGKAVQGASDVLDETLTRASDAMDGDKWSGGGSGDYGSHAGGSAGGSGSFDSGSGVSSHSSAGHDSGGYSDYSGSSSSSYDSSSSSYSSSDSGSSSSSSSSDGGGSSGGGGC
jgi:hypothetical protein